MSVSERVAVGEDWVTQLGQLPDHRARHQFLRHHRELQAPFVVERLTEEVVKLARVDLQQAEHFAQVACWLAQKLDNDYCRARSGRALGHVLSLRGRYQEALRSYQQALESFRRAGPAIEAGITLSSSLQTLIYLGQYEQAFTWAQEAREIFESHGDRLRLARLDSNVGNILYRQDRFGESLELYERAYQYFCEHGNPQDVAVTLRNIAVCHISLNDFPRALEAYQRARAFTEQHGLPLLVLEADYNIAYLYYLRGEYTRAIAMYQTVREQCEKLGDTYHKALCDLDQSELYLELNLSEDGAQLAEEAFAAFQELGMGYEAAKALTNLALASGQQGKAFRALELLTKAREIFVREQNWVWPALIHLYQGVLLYQEGRFFEARRLCEQALRFFLRTSLANKTVLCELLLARIHLKIGAAQKARLFCSQALARLEQIEVPALSHQAYFVLGQIEEAQGNRAAALQAYQQAHARLEDLRSHLQADELKIAFLKDKLAVYEGLVALSLSGDGSPESREAAFACIEQAKSRSLADLIAFRAHALPASPGSRSDLADQVRKLREELNWYYRQVDLHALREEHRTRERIERLRQRIQEHEAELLKVLGLARSADAEFSSLQSAGTVRLDRIRSAIPPDGVVLEYYQARGIIYACLLSSDRLEIVPLTPAKRVRDVLRLLQFQLSKFRLGESYVRTFAEPLRQATLSHLRELYLELLAPLRDQLQARRLIIVPHDFLHYLPFHALFDGERFLIDEFAVSYAPSASVYYLCCQKERRPAEKSLILGIPDPLTPHILEEVQAVASILPNAHAYVGAEASQERLRSDAPASQFVHIATHGLFRQDNPMFSSIRLGDSQLNLFDLYHLSFAAELVTLSGCGTGLNVVMGGDELVGLVRGLLYAGAQSVLVTLWDVHDKSTAEFMKYFYRHLLATPDKALAAQRAMQDLRQAYPHPYYWAPFILIGRGA